MTKSWLLGGVFGATFLVFHSGCADRRVDFVAAVDNGDSGVGTFEPPPSGADGGVEDVVTPEPLLCMATECPYPYATCGTTTTFKCGTNLLRDLNNCGSCGNACPSFDRIHMGSRCVDGACAVECQLASASVTYKDCNGFLDDGCEVNVGDDVNNCGACGHKCQDGVPCFNGKCGCDPGETLCPVFGPGHSGITQQCVDLMTDDANCGTCNTACSAPAAGCNPRPPNTRYGCIVGKCEKLKCQSGSFGDCDDDLGLGCGSNGCETELTKDPNNCGACGNKCKPGQECRDDGSGVACYDICEDSGRTLCPLGCADLLSDPNHCGDCGITCSPKANQLGQCVKGICEFSCTQGWADCDGNPNNGCETDLTNDPTSCGGCGITCDFAAGQPCVEAKCLMTSCDAGVPTK